MITSIRHREPRERGARRSAKRREVAEGDRGDLCAEIASSACGLLAMTAGGLPRRSDRSVPDDRAADRRLTDWRRPANGGTPRPPEDGSAVCVADNDGQGFTLIELLVVTSILAMLMGVLYTSFRTGLTAYARTEEDLIDRREGEIFLIQFEQELKNAIPFYHSKLKIFFAGDKKSLSFPTRLVDYSEKGVSEDLFLVRYEVKGGSLVRTKRKLKRAFKEKREEKETLFTKLKTCRFDFLFLDRSDKLEWDEEWTNKPYVGLPRGVRLTVAGETFGKAERNFEFLIPHGALIKKYS